MFPFYITFSDGYVPDVRGERLTVKFTYHLANWEYSEALKIDSEANTVIVYTPYFNTVYARRKKDADPYTADPLAMQAFGYLRTMAVNKDIDLIYMTKVETDLQGLLRELKKDGFGPPYIIYVDRDR